MPGGVQYKATYYYNVSHKLRIPTKIFEKEAEKMLCHVKNHSKEFQGALVKLTQKKDSTLERIKDKVQNIEEQFKKLATQREQLDKRLNFLLADDSHGRGGGGSEGDSGSGGSDGCSNSGSNSGNDGSHGNEDPSSDGRGGSDSSDRTTGNDENMEMALAFKGEYKKQFVKLRDQEQELNHQREKMRRIQAQFTTHLPPKRRRKAEVGE